jgi:hypothetical protein
LASLSNGDILVYESNTWINSKTINGNLTINGDLYISGTTTTINVDNTNITDNIVLINSGETGAGVSVTIAGIEVDRGTETNYQFVFNETSDTFRIGEIGSLQAVATREDSPNDEGIAFWNNTNNRFDTSTDLTYDGTTLNADTFESDNYFYLGDQSTNGSWRWFINGDGDLEFQKRESGTWNYKNKFT